MLQNSLLYWNFPPFMLHFCNQSSVIKTGGQPRDEVICINERLRFVRLRLEESYKTAKNSLIQLHSHYNESKLQSAIRRYAILKAMIKVTNICTPVKIKVLIVIRGHFQTFFVLEISSLPCTVLKL